MPPDSFFEPPVGPLVRLANRSGASERSRDYRAALCPAFADRPRVYEPGRHGHQPAAGCKWVRLRLDRVDHVGNVPPIHYNDRRWARDLSKAVTLNLRHEVRSRRHDLGVRVDPAGFARVSELVEGLQTEEEYFWQALAGESKPRYEAFGEWDGERLISCELVRIVSAHSLTDVDYAQLGSHLTGKTLAGLGSFCHSTDVEGLWGILREGQIPGGY